MPTVEMYTVKQASIIAKVTEADIRLAVRAGELRAWSLPARRGLLLRKDDIIRWSGDKTQEAR